MENNFNQEISDYRKSLLVLEQQMQSDYDKAIMALSGGALGVSMTFLKDVVLSKGLHGGGFLLAAWICWGASVTSTLLSFYTSALALRKAVHQTDEKSIYISLLGGPYNLATKLLNALAGLLFFCGVLTIVVFVKYNL